MATNVETLIHELRVDIRDTKQKIDEFISGLDKVEKTATSGTAKMSKGFSGLEKAIAGALTIAGVKIAIAKLDQFFTFANKATGVARGFESLTARINETSESMLAKLRPASRGLISDMDLMQQTNTALLLGIPATADTMAELTEGAIALGKAMGIDARFAMESLITGIGRQSRLFLDNLGIVVKVDEANRRYAESLGITTAELTDAQKKLAFFEETVAKVRERQAQLGEQTDTLAEQWTRVKNAIANTTAEAARFANEAPSRTKAALDEQSRQLAEFEVRAAQEAFAREGATLSRRGALEGLASGNLLGYQVLFESTAEAARQIITDLDSITPPDLTPAVDTTLELDRAAAAAADEYERLVQNMKDAAAKLLDVRTRPLGERLGAFQIFPGEGDQPLRQFIPELPLPAPPPLPRADILAAEEKAARAINEIRLRISAEGSEQLLQAELFAAQERHRAEIEQVGALQGENNALLESLAQAHEEELTSIAQQHAEARKQIAAREAQFKIQQTLMTVRLIGDALGGLFQNNKLTAAANAIVNTAEGVTFALKTANFPLAGLIAAAGLVELNTIRKTNIGSGGGGFGPLPAGTSPAGATTPVGDQRPAARPVDLTIFIEGQGFVQDLPGFARKVGQEIADQFNKAGV